MSDLEKARRIQQEAQARTGPRVLRVVPHGHDEFIAYFDPERVGKMLDAILALRTTLAIVENCHGCVARHEDGEFYRLWDGTPIVELNILDPSLLEDVMRP